MVRNKYLLIEEPYRCSCLFERNNSFHSFAELFGTSCMARPVYPCVDDNVVITAGVKIRSCWVFGSLMSTLKECSSVPKVITDNVTVKILWKE
jgi:hypothetical protein